MLHPDKPKKKRQKPKSKDENDPYQDLLAQRPEGLNSLFGGRKGKKKIKKYNEKQNQHQEEKVEYDQ